MVFGYTVRVAHTGFFWRQVLTPYRPPRVCVPLHRNVRISTIRCPFGSANRQNFAIFVNVFAQQIGRQKWYLHCFLFYLPNQSARGVYAPCLSDDTIARENGGENRFVWPIGRFSISETTPSVVGPSRDGQIISAGGVRLSQTRDDNIYTIFIGLGTPEMVMKTT